MPRRSANRTPRLSLGCAAAGPPRQARSGRGFRAKRQGAVVVDMPAPPVEEVSGDRRRHYPLVAALRVRVTAAIKSYATLTEAMGLGQGAEEGVSLRLIQLVALRLFEAPALSNSNPRTADS
jgi:hypothetical protein